MRQEPGRRQLRGISIDADLVDWLTEYARERGLGREHIVETALMQMRERVERV